MCIYGVVNRIIKSSSRIGLTTIVENLCYRVIRKSNTIRKWLQLGNPIRGKNFRCKFDHFVKIGSRYRGRR